MFFLNKSANSEAISALTLPLTLLQSSTSSTILSHLCYHLSWLLGLGNLLPHLATTCHDWALAGRVGLYKMEGLTPHLHHNTVALWERGIGAAGIRISTQKPSQLSLFCKVLLPLLSFHIFATIPLDFLVWATSCHILPRHATTGPLLAGWVSIKWRGLTPHLHHNTVALWERGIGAAGIRISTQKPSQLSLFCKVLLPLLSFHIFATIPLDFLVWATSCHILPRHATTGPLLAGWVSIKWRGLTLHLHHKQGWISIKWRGLTPHLHHSQSFTSLLLIATISLDFLVWATSCHILRRLGPCWQGESL